MKACLKYLVLIFCINFIEGAFRCDYTYSVEAKAWFKYYEIPATFNDARLRCTFQMAKLASPTTSEIKKEMVNIVKNVMPADGEIFTGIHATFSQGDFHTIDGIALDKIPYSWAEGEPDNIDNNENCLTMNGNGNLLDRSCGETLPYICVRTAITPTKIYEECNTIDQAYIFSSATKKCYKFHQIPRIFSRAFLACSAEGGHLAVINSEAEAQFLKNLFMKYPGIGIVGPPATLDKDVAFIGMHDWNEHGDYRTIHGKTIWEAGYAKFKTAEPNNKSGEFCGTISRHSLPNEGLLNDYLCDRPAAFICEKHPKYPSFCKPLPVNVETKRSG